MISELFLYADNTESLFKQIIEQIPALDGRYHVSPNYGADLNTGNLEAFLKDDKYGLTNPDTKYPICVCMAPRSRPMKLNGTRWEQFFFTLYFLQQSNIGDIDPSTNISAKPVYEDWAEMKDAAMQFSDLLETTLRGTVTIDDEDKPFKTLIYIDFSAMEIIRKSNYGVDNISGVELNFILLLNTDVCEVLTIDGIDYIVSRFLPEEDPIWEAEKGNYYTKAEVNDLATPEVSFEVTAGQDLSSGRIVYISAGRAYYYDPSNSLLAGLVLGITKTAALQNTAVTIQLSGIFEQIGLGLTADSKYFIGTNGILTTNLSGLTVVQQAGVSIDTNRLNLNFYSPIITV